AVYSRTVSPDGKTSRNLPKAGCQPKVAPTNTVKLPLGCCLASPAASPRRASKLRYHRMLPASLKATRNTLVSKATAVTRYPAEGGPAESAICSGFRRAGRSVVVKETGTECPTPPLPTASIIFVYAALGRSPNVVMRPESPFRGQ